MHVVGEIKFHTSLDLMSIFKGSKVKKRLFYTILFMVCFLLLVKIDLLTVPYGKGEKIPVVSNDNNVRIGWCGVSVPLGYITLIRNENRYGAIKLTACWKKNGDI